MFNPPRNRKVYHRKDDTWSEKDYIQLFRFKKENVKWLSDVFLGETVETRGGALSSTTKMKIFLRYMADPGFQRGVGEDIGVSQPTVSNTVKYVAKKIVELQNTWIHFPVDDREVQEAKELWLTKYTFPTAIGVIDCSHSKILNVYKTHHPEEYIGRKPYPTINVQATVNANELFTSIDAQWPGSVHDSRIWKNSDICPILRATRNAVLLGDSGYGIEQCLMTPFKNPQTPQEREYNNLFKKERVIVERCFGQLKKRFPILLNTIRLAPELIPSVITACVVLHNVSKYLKDDAVLEEGVEVPNEDSDESDNDDVEEDEEHGRNIRRRQGQQKRNELARIIYERRVANR